MYSIKAISLMTGVKPETLRTWERRYDFLEPARAENGRRQYSDKDARKLGLIAALLDQGHPISRLAELSIEALSALITEPALKPATDFERELLQSLTEALSQCDLDRFRLVVSRVLITQNPVRAVDHILTPAIRQIGSRWSEGKLSVSYEHALSSISTGELLGTISTLQVRAVGPKLVFATPVGEQHHIGLLMGAYISAIEGFRCIILGPDAPSNDLASAALELKAEALVLSVVRQQSFDLTAAHIRQIAGQLDPSIRLFVGAPASFPNIVGADSRIEFFDRYELFQNRLLTLK